MPRSLRSDVLVVGHSRDSQFLHATLPDRLNGRQVSCRSLVRWVLAEKVTVGRESMITAVVRLQRSIPRSSRTRDICILQVHHVRIMTLQSHNDAQVIAV